MSSHGSKNLLRFETSIWIKSLYLKTSELIYLTAHTSPLNYTSLQLLTLSTFAVLIVLAIAQPYGGFEGGFNSFTGDFG